MFQSVYIILSEHMILTEMHNVTLYLIHLVKQITKNKNVLFLMWMLPSLH